MASEEVSDLCASVPSRAKGRNSTPTSEGSPGLRMGPAWRKHPTSPAATSVNPVSDSYAALHGYRRLSMLLSPWILPALLETGGVGVGGECWENYTQKTIEMGVIWPQQCFVWLIRVNIF